VSLALVEPEVLPTTAISVEWWDGARREEAMSVWSALEYRLGGLPVMCSADWTGLWLKHYGSLVPHRFAIGRADGRIVGLLLLTCGVDDRDGWFRTRTWHIGTAGESDADSVCIEYNAVACEPAYRNALFAATQRHLDQESDWDELRLDGFAVDDGPVLENPGEWMQVRRSARWIDLGRVRESGRELTTFMGDSTRKSIRQNLRDYGPVTVDEPASLTEAHAIFDELVRLHQERWTSEGHPGCYASKVFTAFHRELIDRCFGNGRVQLLRVRAGDVTLGCTEFLIDRERALNYQGGRLANDRKHSPGLITDFAGMQFALERGYSAYDFMAGDSIHKQRLTTDSTPLVWLVRRRPRLKYAVMQRVRRARQQIHQWFPTRSSGAKP
jgi:hypothetical protein